jgi:hypothetical protein
MIKFASWHDEEEAHSTLSYQDALGILSSTRTVALQSKHVFRASAISHTHPVKFLRRARICLADLSNAFGDQQWGTFADLE